MDANADDNQLPGLHGLTTGALSLRQPEINSTVKFLKIRTLELRSGKDRVLTGILRALKA